MVKVNIVSDLEFEAEHDFLAWVLEQPREECIVLLIAWKNQRAAAERDTFPAKSHMLTAEVKRGRPDQDVIDQLMQEKESAVARGDFDGAAALRAQIDELRRKHVGA